jgi:hypothetical protein
MLVEYGFPVEKVLSLKLQNSSTDTSCATLPVNAVALVQLLRQVFDETLTNEIIGIAGTGAAAAADEDNDLECPTPMSLEAFLTERESLAAIFDSSFVEQSKTFWSITFTQPGLTGTESLEITLDIHFLNPNAYPKVAPLFLLRGGLLSQESRLALAETLNDHAKSLAGEPLIYSVHTELLSRLEGLTEMKPSCVSSTLSSLQVSNKCTSAMAATAATNPSPLTTSTSRATAQVKAAASTLSVTDANISPEAASEHQASSGTSMRRGLFELLEASYVMGLVSHAVLLAVRQLLLRPVDLFGSDAEVCGFF